MTETLSPEYFTPGTPVLVESRRGKREFKSRTQIIGAYPPRYLLLAEPMLSGEPMLASTEQQCILRFVKKGLAFGFRAEVVSHQLTPFQMLTVTYPKTFEQVSVRKQDRIGCGIPSTMVPLSAHSATDPTHDAPNPAPLKATILDLSATGCQIAIPIFTPDQQQNLPSPGRPEIPPEQEASYTLEQLRERISRDDSVQLAVDFPPPWPEHFDNILCKVRWEKTFRGYYVIGAKFTEMPERFRDNVSKLIDYQLTYFNRPW
jgi:hypothetical protein